MDMQRSQPRTVPAGEVQAYRKPRRLPANQDMQPQKASWFGFPSSADSGLRRHRRTGGGGRQAGMALQSGRQMTLWPRRSVDCYGGRHSAPGASTNMRYLKGESCATGACWTLLEQAN